MRKSKWFQKEKTYELKFQLYLPDPNFSRVGAEVRQVAQWRVLENKCKPKNVLWNEFVWLFLTFKLIPKYQTTWPASWEISMQLRKQQLELDMEQQTGSKEEKE